MLAPLNVKYTLIKSYLTLQKAIFVILAILVLVACSQTERALKLDNFKPNQDLSKLSQQKSYAVIYKELDYQLPLILGSTIENSILHMAILWPNGTRLATYTFPTTSTTIQFAKNIPEQLTRATQNIITLSLHLLLSDELATPSGWLRQNVGSKTIFSRKNCQVEFLPD